MTSISVVPAQAASVATNPLLVQNPHKPATAKGLKGAQPLPTLSLSQLPHNGLAASAAASAAQFAAHTAQYHHAKEQSKAPVVAVQVDCSPFAPKGRGEAIASIVVTQPMFGATLLKYDKANGAVVWEGPRVVVIESAEMLCTAEVARAAIPQTEGEHFQYMIDVMRDLNTQKAK